MLVALITLGALGAPPTVAEHWPCTPGLSIRYRVEKAGRDTGLRVEETVRRRVGRFCHVDRVVTGPGRDGAPEGFVLEYFDDRVLYAGFEGALTAFRPPLLKAPLAKGAGWTFNRVGYRISGVALRVEVPAGRFEGCVRVVEKDLKGKEHAGEVVYAPGVGPIVKVTNGTRMVADRVRRAGADAKAPSKPRGWKR